MGLTLPQHFLEKNANVQDFHTTNMFDLQVAAVKWATQNNLKPVASDKKRVHLLIIDQQDDFVFPQGSLYVSGRSGTGAIDDSSRLAKFIYSNANIITEITDTMDSHLLYQVFFPSAHILSDGSHPAPFTMISADDYRSGKYHANPQMAAQLGVDQSWLNRQFTYYCQQLESTGRFNLTVWPYHCLIGSYGHKLSGLVYEAIAFHAFARGSTNNPAIKGGNPLTEHYSIFKPEVNTTWDGKTIPGVQTNVSLLETLYKSDYVIIAGMALSHCVLWSLTDLVDFFYDNDRNSLKKIYVMTDCTSSVVIPGVVDFTDDSIKRLQEIADKGINLVKSSDPISTWSDFIL